MFWKMLSGFHQPKIYARFIKIYVVGSLNVCTTFVLFIFNQKIKQ